MPAADLFRPEALDARGREPTEGRLLELRPRWFPVAWAGLWAGLVLAGVAVAWVPVPVLLPGAALVDSSATTLVVGVAEAEGSDVRVLLRSGDGPARVLSGAVVEPLGAAQAAERFGWSGACVLVSAPLPEGSGLRAGERPSVVVQVGSIPLWQRWWGGA